MKQDQLLWNSTEVCTATGGFTSNEWNASGISIDSRTILSGDLFIPIKGPNFDGHDFITQALSKGAVASLVCEGTRRSSEGESIVYVEDTCAALNSLGAAGRKRSEAEVIAVTGSVGKTSVKEALGFLLSEQGSTYYSHGSFNNHFGVPLSLARLPRESRYAIFELGMNHAGELTPLSKMVKPAVV